MKGNHDTNEQLQKKTRAASNSQGGLGKRCKSAIIKPTQSGDYQSNRKDAQKSNKKIPTKIKNANPMPFDFRKK